MIKWFKNLFSEIKLAYLDVVNHKKFIMDFKEEEEDPKSLIARYQMVLSEDKKRVSMITIVDNIFAQYEDDIMLRTKLKEVAQVFNQYLTVNLGWSEYFYAPEFFKIDDDTLTDKDVSLTYLISWEWAPKIINNPKFWWKIAGISLGTLAVLGGIITGLIFLI